VKHFHLYFLHTGMLALRPEDSYEVTPFKGIRAALNSAHSQCEGVSFFLTVHGSDAAGSVKLKFDEGDQRWQNN
jgi:hypothetical protein